METIITKQEKITVQNANYVVQGVFTPETQGAEIVIMGQTFLFLTINDVAEFKIAINAVFDHLLHETKSTQEG